MVRIVFLMFSIVCSPYVDYSKKYPVIKMMWAMVIKVVIPAIISMRRVEPASLILKSLSRFVPV